MERYGKWAIRRMMNSRLRIPGPRLKTGAINPQMLAILWARRVFRPTSAYLAHSPVRRFELGRCGRFAGELRQEFFVSERMREHRKVMFYRVLVRFFANGGCAIFQRNHVVAQFISCPHR
jgi:hypothetical protein